MKKTLNRLLLVFCTVLALSGCSTGRFAKTRQIHLGVAKNYIGQLVWPTPGGKVISPFGWRGFKFHEGLDIKAETGHPVYAAHAGDVVYSGAGLNGYGNLVVVKGKGLLTIYAHNSRNLVTAGDYVQIGDEIALVGMTGNAEAPHLHFETRIRDEHQKNVAVNPLVFWQVDG